MSKLITEDINLIKFIDNEVVLLLIHIACVGKRLLDGTKNRQGKWLFCTFYNLLHEHSQTFIPALGVTLKDIWISDVEISITQKDVCQLSWTTLIVASWDLGGSCKLFLKIHDWFGTVSHPCLLLIPSLTYMTNITKNCIKRKGRQIW